MYKIAYFHNFNENVEYICTFDAQKLKLYVKVENLLESEEHYDTGARYQSYSKQ